MDKYKIRTLYRNNLLHDIDIKFSDLMADLSGDTASDELCLAAVLVSSTTTEEKHICFDLEAAAGKSLAELFPEIPEHLHNRLKSIQTPNRTAWTEKLKKSPVVGAPGEYRPLVLDEKNRLYLYRYWDYEQKLANTVRNRVGKNPGPVDLQVLQAGLRRYFTHAGPGTDWQKVAAYTAVTNNLCIISGGPGTGKTYTVTTIMALLLEQDENLRISVCAPTGKAAARLQESIKQAKAEIKCARRLLEKIPEEAKTLHRLLGVKRGSPHFYHNGKNPVPSDVLIVDEASMVSLALMSKLFQATTSRTRIILLGDKNQLASVEAGAVLGDICAAADTGSFSEKFCNQCAGICGKEIIAACAPGITALSDCAVELQYSYRFDRGSAIGEVSRAVNNGDVDRAVNIIEKDTAGTIMKRPLPDRNELESHLVVLLEEVYGNLFKVESVSEAFSIFETFRVLCSHRQGACGVDGINHLMETLLHEKGLIDTSGPYYPGRPIMVSRNDYGLKLYNGDVGLLWKDDNGEIRAFFPDREGGFRALSPVRLPAHETVYAMTIHKSQGSEFDRVLMILPALESPIFTRELIYTGITRARKSVEIWADDSVFKTAIRTRVKRRSGLKDALTFLP